MKINYDEIITKANARKDALQTFGAEIGQAHLLLRDIQGLAAHLAGLKASMAALDTEARQMIGENRLIPLQRLCENYAGLVSNAQLSCGFGQFTSWKVLSDFAAEADQEASQA